MELKCVFQNKHGSYDCDITNAVITERGTVINSIKGEHLNDKIDVDVNDIFFGDSSVHFFPRGLATIFPNLKFVNIMNCGLKEITAEDLIGLENITVLNLAINELTSLPTNLLTNMKNLESISFCNNRLTHVSPKMFDLPFANQLKSVMFTNNTNIDASYSIFPSFGFNTLQLLKDTIQSKCLPPIEDETSLISERDQKMKDLCTSGWLSDIIIVCESTNFKVHKLVLGSHSSVFSAFFNKLSGRRSQIKIEIHDFSKVAVETFLKYFYLGHVETESNAMELFALASRFDVPTLKSTSMKMILSSLNELNALEILEFGQQHESDEITWQSFTVLTKMLPEFKMTDELLNIPGHMRKLFEAKFEITQAQLLEEEKFKAAKRLKDENLKAAQEKFISDLKKLNVERV